MRVLVCGGRNFDDRKLLDWALEPFKSSETVIIHGAAAGADHMASVWAKAHGIPVERYPADWKKHGKAAGPIRNQRMIDEGKPDLVIAFPGGRGTHDMCVRAEAAGIQVEDIGWPKWS